MSGNAKLIGSATAVLGLLAAFFVVLTRYQEYKKSKNETEVAERRSRAELEERKDRTPPAVSTPTSEPPTRPTPKPVPTPLPPPVKPAPPKREPARPAKSASELFVPDSVWEGPSGTFKMRMEVKAVRGKTIAGKLHWYGPGGALTATAKMTGRVVDPDQVSFQYQPADIEYGSNFVGTAYAGTLSADDEELRGNWGRLGEPLTGGTFSLTLLP